jgi:hypothetical protein
VFVGSGDILAIPPDPIEKRQLFRYTKAALLTEQFETAIFRFTDETREDVLKEIRRQAPDPVDAADVEALVRWEAELQRRSTYLNARLLADLIGSKSRPFFLAQIEGRQLGWFDAIYDERRVEEVLLQQNTTASPRPLVWSSFNKKSEARDSSAAAREDKFLFDTLTADPESSIVRMNLKADGERVLELPLSSAGVTRVSMDGNPIPLLSSTDNLTVILPAPSRSGSEIALAIEVPPESRAAFFSRIRDRTNSVAPASYRDEWIIEALANYGAALSDHMALTQAREQLLATSPAGGSYESAGPVWIGFRMIQPGTGPGAAAFKAKSIWILHMLRNVMRRDDGDPAFGRFLDDVLAEGKGARISTFDFKRIAEKHAGKPLDWFFDSWVFGTGIPSYAISSKVESTATGFVISGNITQSGVPVTFEMQVPVYADEVFLGNVTVNSDGGEFRFTSKSMPQQVLVDPKKIVLTQN